MLESVLGGPLKLTFKNPELRLNQNCLSIILDKDSLFRTPKAIIRIQGEGNTEKFFTLMERRSEVEEGYDDVFLENRVVHLLIH